MWNRSTIPPTKVADTIALLGALCLFLSTIEYLIPRPIPFLRVGIANLPLLISLPLLSPSQFYLLILLKVAGQGLVNGTLASYVILFSAAGSFTSGTVMLLVYRLAGRRISAVGTSVIGALAGNCAQIVLARLLIFGEGAWLIAPPFLAIGTVSSALLGLFAERFSRSSRWLASLRAEI
jgi:heptaprenyl diphosphate synthase